MDHKTILRNLFGRYASQGAKEMNCRIKMVILVCMILCLYGCTEKKERYQVIASNSTEIPAEQVTAATINTAIADVQETVQMEVEAPSAMNRLDDWLNGENWIKKTFVNRNGIHIDLNMPEPASFPESLYEITLQGRYGMDVTKAQAMDILLIDEKDLRTNYLSLLDGTLQYSPGWREDNEFGTNGYPLLQPIKSEQSTDTIMLVGDNRTTKMSQWEATNVSLSKVRTLLQKSEKMLSQLGCAYREPSSIYMSQLTDGTPVMEILYPMYLEGLPMQSATYYDVNHDDDTDWGHMPWNIFHLIYDWEQEKLYYCSIGYSYSEVQRNVISEPMISYTQALQALVSARMNTLTSKQYKNQRFVVYAVRPCYVKVPIQGVLTQSVAKPAWEIAYYATDSNSADTYMDSFHWVDYVDARTSEVYGR